MSKVTLSGANIVIVANTHNPSIVSKEWAMEKGMITGSVINFIHTPTLSVIETNDLNIILDPERLQILAKNVNTIDMLPKIAEIYIRNLPEIPYVAIGLNFTYQIIGGRIENVIVPSEKLKEVLPECNLGAIIIFSYEKFIVTMTLRPADDKIVANFNFHSNIRKSQEALDRLKHYEEAKGKSKSILEVLFE